MKKELLNDCVLSFLSRMLVARSRIVVEEGQLATLYIPENLADIKSEKVLQELKTAFSNAGCELNLKVDLQGVGYES